MQRMETMQRMEYANLLEKYS